jgi:hypothetical protein
MTNFVSLQDAGLAFCVRWQPAKTVLAPIFEY